MSAVPEAIERRPLRDGEFLKPQFRTATIDLTKAEIDTDKRWVRNVSISSDEPYQRWFGSEILSHEPSAIRSERATTNAMPLLFNHDRNVHLGKPHNFRIEGGKAYVDLFFSENPLPQEKLRDLRDGILTETSIAYQVHKFEVDEDEEIYTAKDWELLECSLVTIPADFTVGVSRNFEKEGVNVRLDFRNPEKKPLANSQECEQTRAMPETAAPVTPAPAAPTIEVNEREIDARLNAELARREEIEATQKHFAAHGVTEDDAKKFIGDRAKTTADFKLWILENRMNAKPVTTSPAIGMSEKDLKKYSLHRAMRSMLDRRQVDGLEKECHEAAMKSCDYKDVLTATSFIVPYDVLAARAMEGQRALTAGVFNAAGVLIGTTNAGQSMIELLRNKMRVIEMGARVIGGLSGNVAISKQTGAATAYWLPENGTITLSNLTVGQVTLTPKRLGAASDVSMSLLTQSSEDVESILRADAMKVLALARDKAVLVGTGASGEPKGIQQLGTELATSVTLANAGTMTYAEAVRFEKNIEDENADVETMGFLATPTVKAGTKVTAMFSNTGFPVWGMDGTVNGYRARTTKQLTGAATIMFGDWSSVVIGEWGGLVVTLDPFTQALAGSVRFIFQELVDNVVRQPKSFSISTN